MLVLHVPKKLTHINFTLNCTYTSHNITHIMDFSLRTADSSSHFMMDAFDDSPSRSSTSFMFMTASSATATTSSSTSFMTHFHMDYCDSWDASGEASMAGIRPSALSYKAPITCGKGGTGMNPIQKTRFRTDPVGPIING